MDKSVTVRLKEEDRERLNQIADYMAINQTAVIKYALRELARKLDLPEVQGSEEEKKE